MILAGAIGVPAGVTALIRASVLSRASHEFVQAGYILTRDTGSTRERPALPGIGFARLFGADP